MAIPEQHFDSTPEAHLSLLEIIRETFWIFVLAAITGFLFLLLIGAFTLSEMWKGAIFVAVIAALWGVHVVREHRGGAEYTQALRRVRERRGF